MNTLTLTQKSTQVIGNIQIPRSKSISNRALIIAELAGKGTRIAKLSEADDTRLLKKHLAFIRSWGASGIPTIFDVENAGTVARFLTAYLVSHEGEWLVTGCRRMKERPIGALVDGLTRLGAKIRYRGKEGFLPIQISGNDINGGEIKVDTTMSSQFVTAILLIGPYLDEGLKITFSNEVVSKSYINMTVEMMKSFGARVSLFDKYVVVEPHPYKRIDY
ncbi:MAG: 3-phosphoshikimate 1-carboxyvinyltransferase, partial [Bacteroidales bacterium]